MRAQVPVHFVPEDPVRLQEQYLLYPLTRNLQDHHQIYDPRTAADALAVAIAFAWFMRFHYTCQVSSEEKYNSERHETPHITTSTSLFHLLFNNETAALHCGERPIRYPHPLRVPACTVQCHCVRNHPMPHKWSLSNGWNENRYPIELGTRDTRY